MYFYNFIYLLDNNLIIWVWVKMGRITLDLRHFKIRNNKNLFNSNIICNKNMIQTHTAQLWTRPWTPWVGWYHRAPLKGSTWCAVETPSKTWYLVKQKQHIWWGPGFSMTPRDHHHHKKLNSLIIAIWAAEKTKGWPSRNCSLPSFFFLRKQKTKNLPEKVFSSWVN